MKHILVLGALAMLSGCTTFTPPATKDNLKNGNIWLTYDTSRRGTMIVPTQAKTTYRFCAEPAPDVALTLANKLGADITQPTGGIKVNGTADLSATASALAGRTETVVLAREAMFRLCEAYVNNALTPAQYQENFTSILALVKDLVALDREAQVTRQEAERTKQAKAIGANKILDTAVSSSNSSIFDMDKSGAKPALQQSDRDAAIAILKSIE